MGINKNRNTQSKTSWKEVVEENRKKIKKCRCQQPEEAYKYCIIHGYFFSGAPNRNNIHTTPQVEAQLRMIAQNSSSKMGQKFEKNT